MITIKTNAKDLARLLQHANTKAVRQATARSLNEIARSARAKSAKDIRQEVNLKAGDIKAAIKQQNAKAQQPVDEQQAQLAFSRKPIPLAKFGAKPRIVGRTRSGKPITGVSVKVKNQRKVVQGAFLANMKSGHQGVYMRKGEGKRIPYKVAPYVKLVVDGRGNRSWVVASKHWSQLPIAEKFGPTIGDVASNKSVQTKLEQLVRTTYAEVFSRNLRFYMGRAR